MNPKTALSYALSLLCISISIFVVTEGFAQTTKPVWASSYGSSTTFQPTAYYTGFGMISVSNNVPLEQAISEAEASSRQDLIQKIRVQVSSLSASLLEETNDSYSSQFLSATETRSSLELFGLNTQNFVDRANNTVYALSHINKETVREQFLEQFRAHLATFQRLATHAADNLAIGNNELAFSQFQEAKTVYSNLTDTWAVLQSVERGMTGIQPTRWNPEEIRDEVQKVDRSLDRIVNRPITSIEDASWWIARTLGAHADKNYRVNISAITFRDTGVSSEFANYFRQLLARQLNERTNWTVMISAERQNPDHILTGTFWDRGDDIHLILHVRNLQNGNIVAASEVSLPKDVIGKSNIQLLPENYEQVLADLKALQSPPDDSRGLNLAVWTNRGENNLVFEEGDLMEVSLQVNLPSYIRILYHLKDGNRVLLLDSHYIGPRDVNKPYTLPYRFQCVPPFGVETMQVIARNEPFERIQTREINGMPILVEDLDRFLANTRGFIMVKEEAQQTERVLTITTMPKVR